MGAADVSARLTGHPAGSHCPGAVRCSPFQKILHFTAWHGAAEIEALNQVAAQALQDIQLGFRLHPFGQRFQIQAFGQGDDDAGNRLVVGIRGDIPDKRNSILRMSKGSRLR